MLQERLESTRFQLHQEERKVGQLQVDLQAAAEELQFWREQRTHHVEKLDQVREIDVQVKVDLVLSSPHSSLVSLKCFKRRTEPYRLDVLFDH